MTGVTVSSDVGELDSWGDQPKRSCSCPICQSAAARGEQSTHAMASGIADAGAGVRAAEMLTQYRGADGHFYYSGDRNVDAILIGAKWSSTSLTYAFPTSGATYGARYDFGQALRQVPFNEAQIAATRDAFRMVASYTGLTFTEVAPDSAERPTLRLSSTSLEAVGSAMGYFPHTAEDLGGDIWFGRSQQPYYETPARGNWGYVTVLHEVGHTLGLKHGHSDYTAEDLGSFFGLDTELYGTQALEYRKDGQLWSLMTYTTAPDVVDGFNGDAQNQAQTYMMYDIAALQYMYGANYGTNAGNTVYRWDPATGVLSVNGVAQQAPAGNKVLETVWDGGGDDTYDLSAYDGDLALDLRPGEVSTLSIEQRANALAYVDGYAPIAGNIGNALLYKGDAASLIENAIGGSGNDRIVGNQADNRLEGGAGNDLLVGGRGSDRLIGGAGNDVADLSNAVRGISVTLNNGVADIVVSDGVDRDVLSGIEGIVGTTFNDTLTGDDGDNILSGGRGGRDTIKAGKGNDTLIGAADDVTQVDKADIVKAAGWYNQSQDAAIGLDGAFDLVADTEVERAETLPHATVRATGTAGGIDYYRFSATAGASAIFDLDDMLAGVGGMEIVDAAGNIVAANYGEATSDDGSRGGGNPYLTHVFTTSGTFYVRVGATRFGYENGVETFSLGDFFGDTDYTLNVSVEGAAVETVVNAIGSGRFAGGKGDDLIIGASGNDGVSGGEGIDTLSYANARNRVTVDLSITAAQDTGAGRDTITEIENLTGSRFGDTLSGDAGDNVINGGGGSDRLTGGEGRDTLSFAGQSRKVDFSLARQGAGQAAQLGATVWATGFENLEGGNGGDKLAGDAGANRIAGGRGNDVVAGGVNDAGMVDTLDGGEGNDLATFADYSDGLTITMRGGGTGDARTAVGAVATFSGIEAVQGGRGDDVLTGDGDANRLSGGAGDDRLVGGAGKDTLEGGTGNDMLLGGAGTDTAVFAGSGRHTVDLSQTGAQDTGLGRDTLREIENLRGGTGEDEFIGSRRDNIFFEAGGDDVYDGREGVDTVNYENATTLLEVNLATTIAQDTRAGGVDRLVGIESIVGGDHGNILYGDGGANGLTGGAERDVVFGGSGADRLEGGDGDDLLMGDSSGRTDPQPGVSMDDVMFGGSGSDRLLGGEGDDLLYGGSGNDVLVGGGGVVSRDGDGFSLDGVILMDGGRDTLDGGEGDDLGIVYYAGRREAITIDNRVTDATNAVLFDGVAHGSLTGIETLRFYGGDGADRVETSAGYDVLQGGAGNDYLSAGQGDDSVMGGAGDDWMDGGEGVDLLSYAGSTTGVTVDLARTDAQDTGGGGVDTIRNFENLTTTAFSDLVYGNAASNTIRDYGGGDDTIFGMDGSDSIGVFRQYGQAGGEIIYLDGGDGSDVVEYFSELVYDRAVPLAFYRLTDDVTLIGGEGRDGIYMSGQKTGRIDAGAGDDVVTIGIGGLAETSIDITLGAGRDVLALGYVDNYLGEIDRFANIVQDFEAGADGDRVNLTNVLGGYYTGTNPFAIDQMELMQVGDDVQLRIDIDRAGTDFQWRTFLTFQGTVASDFTADNFFITSGDGTFVPITEEPWDPHAGAQAGTTGFATAAFATPATDLPAIAAGSDGWTPRFVLDHHDASMALA